MQIRQKKYIFWSIFILLFVLSVPGYAWKSKHEGTASSEAQTLSNNKKRELIRDVTHLIAKDPFFAKAPVSRKVTLSLLSVHGADMGMTDKQFTDAILSRLVNSTRIFIVNVEIDPDLSKSYKLMHYSKGLKLRKKGLLLGANYYIEGSLESHVSDVGNDRIEEFVIATLFVRDIQTNAVVIKKEYSKKSKTNKRTQRK